MKKTAFVLTALLALGGVAFAADSCNCEKAIWSV